MSLVLLSLYYIITLFARTFSGNSHPLYVPTICLYLNKPKTVKSLLYKVHDQQITRIVLLVLFSTILYATTASIKYSSFY